MDCKEILKNPLKKEFLKIKEYHKEIKYCIENNIYTRVHHKTN